MGRQRTDEAFSSERRAFGAYLRTGGRPVGRIEVKFDPNHDPANGQFTFGPGGGTGGAREAAGSAGHAAYGAHDPRNPRNCSIHVAKHGETLADVAKLRKGVRVSDLA